MNLFDHYLETIENEDHRACIKDVFSWVEETFPSLKPKIAWNQPMFTDHETFIIGFSVSKQHFAISPEAKTISVYSNAIKDSGYTHGSNIFRIKWNDPIDFSLLQKIIQYNMEDKMNCSTFWRK